MKSVLLSVSVSLALIFAWTRSGPTANSPEDITMCGSPSKEVSLNAAGKYIAALPGWGKLHYPITTTSDSAQFYFNQGLSLYYSYHFPEAIASFKESSRFDPAAAMGYWGQALASGPFYNTFVYKMPASVPGIVEKMTGRRSALSEKEKDLVDALRQRYSNDLTNADRPALDQNYAKALRDLMTKYPGDQEIKALYVDAIMLQHKWDFWQHDGTPKPWTNEVVAICEDVLRKANHPAIMHYYIHLTEASRQPERALAAADALKDQLPGVGHMVHMSSHMYQRNGLYQKGVMVNDAANIANNNMEELAPGLGIGKDKSIHYYAVQSYCAMTAGMYAKGLRIYERARERQVAVKPDFGKETYTQFVFMMPVMAHVRLGKWEEVLASKAPDIDWKYAIVLDQFAKGIAHLRRSEPDEARRNLAALNQAMKDPRLSIRYMPFNSPLQSCRIASLLLTAELRMAEGNHDDARKAYEEAVVEEDRLVYREPQDWLIPARQYYGAALLKLKEPRAAEKVYAEDLELNPGNGWSLTGMVHSLKAQGKETEAAAYEAKAKKAFAESDVVITASVF